MSRAIRSLKRLVLDGWSNVMSGLGLADKSSEYTFAADSTLSQEQLAELYDNFWLAQRVVDAMPAQALRRGLVAPEEQLARFRELNTDNRYPAGVLQHGLRMGRLFGGAAILIGVQGSGQGLEQEWQPGQGEVTFLHVFTRFDLESTERYETPEEPKKNGRTSVWKVTKGPFKDLLIHESRLIVCEGAPKVRLTEDQADIDWPWLSVLQSVHKTLAHYGISWQSISVLLQEASIGVMTLKGFADLLTGQNQDVVQARLEAISQGRSVARTVFLDEGETFSRVSASFADLPALMQELSLAICGAAEIPATILFGRSPAGMNATGESDMQQWYDRCETYRQNSIKPKLDRLLLAIQGAAVEYSFANMWEPSEKEKAELRKNLFAGDQLAFSLGVIDPDQIFASRARDGSLGIQIEDVDKVIAERKAAAAAAAAAKVELTPSDRAKVMTVNEIRGSNGLPPLVIPGTSTPDPDGDLLQFIYEAKKLEEVRAAHAPQNPDQSSTQPGTGQGAEGGPGQVPDQDGGARETEAEA